MDRPRDYQRSRLYKAEDSLPERKQLLRRGSLKACQEFVDSITATRFWRTHMPHMPYVSVTPGVCHAIATLEHATIAMPPSLRSELIILHELAHLMSFHDAQISYHGPEFAWVYSDLVRRFMGGDVSRRLHAAFREYGVECERPVERGGLAARSAA